MCAFRIVWREFEKWPYLFIDASTVLKIMVYKKKLHFREKRIENCMEIIAACLFVCVMPIPVLGVLPLAIIILSCNLRIFLQTVHHCSQWQVKNAKKMLRCSCHKSSLHLLFIYCSNFWKSSLTKHIGTKGRCSVSQRWPCHSHLPCSLAAITSDVWIKRAQSTNTCRERWGFRRIRRGMILTSGTNENVSRCVP